MDTLHTLAVIAGDVIPIALAFIAVVGAVAVTKLAFFPSWGDD